ncbi:MAG TPA: FG-GAP repeat protein, partial [Gemmataceae bacterium]|nr:FG-GAP repeat protein [Gemmataceae bacterium]
ALETETCDHLTCAAGDLHGDGRPDLVIGNFLRGGRPGDALTVWRNITKKPVGKGPGRPDTPP